MVWLSLSAVWTSALRGHRWQARDVRIITTMQQDATRQELKGNPRAKWQVEPAAGHAVILEGFDHAVVG
jgi:hypothetical protein